LGIKELYIRKSSGLLKSITARNALIANLIGMGIVVNIFWVVYASAGYPSADLPTTVFLGLILSLLIAYVYWMLSSAMPRAGGDYIYVSRIFHPSLGFIVNAMFVAIMITWVGLFPQYTALYALPIMFTNLATVTGNTAFSSAATWLQTTSGQFIVGAIIIGFVILLSLAPVKWMIRVLVGIFVVQVIGYLWFIGALATTSNSAFLASFNAKSGMIASSLLNTAQTNGVGWTITVGGTLIGIVYTMLSYVGYANSAYFAGEVRGNPKRSQGLAIFVAPIIFSVLIYLLYAEIYNVFGHSFLVASSSLWATSNSAWSGPVMPSPAYLVSFISSNPVFVAIVPLSLALTFIGFAIVYFFVPVRNIFGWSFDRVIPSAFANVSRYGVPWLAVLLFGAVAYVSLYVSVYTTIFGYLAYANLGWWIAVAVVMFAGAAFPFRNKGIFDSAPDIVRKKIGGVPVITIIGIVGGFLSLFVSYSTTLPSYAGFAINPYYVATIVVVFVIALVVYLISYAVNKSRGLPVELIAKELPPE
jgi:amino acid transporter